MSDSLWWRNKQSAKLPNFLIYFAIAKFPDRINVIPYFFRRYFQNTFFCPNQSVVVA